MRLSVDSQGKTFQKCNMSGFHLGLLDPWLSLTMCLSLFPPCCFFQNQRGEIERTFVYHLRFHIGRGTHYIISTYKCGKSLACLCSCPSYISRTDQSQTWYVYHRCPTRVRCPYIIRSI